MIKRRVRFKKQLSGDDEIDELFAAKMNAMVVKHSEEYYRTMIGTGTQNWNLRDLYMMQMLEAIIKYLGRQRGKPIKAIVWAHNSHVGDARHTHKGELQKKWNIGQLARERFGMDKIYNVRFTTHTGSDRETKNVNLSRTETYEHLFHTVSEESSSLNFLLNFNYIEGEKKLPISQELINELADKARLKERAIGVIYHPDTELQSHYFYAKISLQFDSIIYIDITNSLKSLPDKTEDELHRKTLGEKELPETFLVEE
ncbi:hypothetical protein RclHR1_15820008 [Rhizophagus clarus]|uniref:Erythromycin esterase family protein n=1 Tax=Rhizophagus clarus TaxID=94130 RepID=A0A2Z6QK81_9GLOM|nr:hypothetical protein RclHR1_15820008 [Rhizophagus clarus]GES76876.1 erythromycin esterase family protein [Rhizophagus clarus]